MSEKVDIKIVDEDKQNGAEAGQPEPATEESPQQGGDPAAETDLADRLAAAETKADDYYDRLLRTSAEFDNYKKRTAREMRDTIKFANERILKDLLIIVDNLERATDAVCAEDQKDNPLLQGIHLTLNELLKLLEQQGVKPIQAIDEPFDPTFHQAMMQEEVEGKPANTVVREMQKGYLIHDRLLRPALVGVSKATQGKADESDSQQQDQN